MPAVLNPARRSGVSKSKEENGQPRRFTRGCVDRQAKRARGAGHLGDIAGERRRGKLDMTSVTGII